MSMPGFTAGASIVPNRYCHVGTYSFDDITSSARIVPMNGLYPPWPIPPELWPYLSPEELRRIIGPYIAFWEAAQKAAAAEGAAGAGAIGALAAVILAAVGWLGWKSYVAGWGESPPPTVPPGSIPPPGQGYTCGGFLNTNHPPAKGWGVDVAHLTKSGCQVAIEDAIQNASNYCATLTPMCTGTCPPGQRCTAQAVVDRVSNQTHLFWCGARVHYRCACYCV